MNRNLKTVVYSVLDTDEYAREDDNYLIQQTLIRMLPCNAGTAFGQVLQGMKYKGISFEAITRHRRKYLENHPELKNKKTEEARRKEEENYIVEFGR